MNNNTYTYKPTVNAIQYTGSIDKVIEFIGRESISHLDTDIYDDPSIGDLVINLYAIATIILAYEKYLVKETFDDGKIEYKTMDEDEFKRYFKQINTPIRLEQAVCDTTESAADTTPCEDEPEQGGRVDYSENYYYIDSFGGIACTSDLDTYMDIARYKFGNYFHTEKETEQARDERLLQLKCRQWRKQHDPAVLDKSGLNKKWSIYPNGDGTVDILFTRNRASVFDKILSSESLAERFYAEHKDLIHRVLGVE